MSDKSKVYFKVLRTLNRMMSHIDSKHILILTMMITGILLGKKAQLSEMSCHIPHQAKPESIVKRFHRFVKNERVDVQSYYLPFAQAILSHLSGQTLHLALDASQVGRGCMVLMVSVIYKNKALPLAWLVYEGKKGHTTADRHIKALKMVLPLIPAHANIALFGDAEYDTVEMLTWVKEKTNWHYVIRTDPRTKLKKGDHSFFIRDLLIGERWRTIAHQVLFTAPKRVTRLPLATALTYIWMIYLGIEIFQDESRRAFIDRTHRTDKSLFRLGFDWIKVALTRNFDFEVMFSPQDISTPVSVR